MSDQKATINATLSGHIGWTDWLEEVESEAMRMGVETAFTNAVAGNPPGILANAVRQLQSYRNLTKAVKDSLKGPVRTYSRDHGGNLLTAGGIVRLLREGGGFGNPNYTEQRISNTKEAEIRFTDRDQPACPTTFLSDRREHLRQLPSIYPPTPNVPAADNLNTHILQLSSKWFGKGFKETIARLEEEENTTSEAIKERINKRYMKLTETGDYKVENSTFGKAFPVQGEEYEKGEHKIQREGDDDSSNAFVTVSKKSLARMKMKERKKTTAQVYSSKGDTISSSKGKEKGGYSGKGEYGKNTGWRNKGDYGGKKGGKGSSPYGHGGGHGGKGKGDWYYNAQGSWNGGNPRMLGGTPSPQPYWGQSYQGQSHQSPSPYYGGKKGGKGFPAWQPPQPTYQDPNDHQYHYQ